MLKRRGRTRRNVERPSFALEHCEETPTKVDMPISISCARRFMVGRRTQRYRNVYAIRTREKRRVFRDGEPRNLMKREVSWSQRLASAAIARARAQQTSRLLW